MTGRGEKIVDDGMEETIGGDIIILPGLELKVYLSKGFFLKTQLSIFVDNLGGGGGGSPAFCRCRTGRFAAMAAKSG